MGNESGDYSHICKRGQKEKTITVMKRYRILEKIHNEGTEYEISWFYPQYMDSHTLDQNVAVTWYNVVNSTGGAVTCLNKAEAVKFVQKKRAEDIPPRERIHEIE